MQMNTTLSSQLRRKGRATWGRASPEDWSEQMKLLEGRSLRLQLRRNADRIQLLALFGVEQRHKLRKKLLLCLHNLLLQGVNPNDQHAGLGGLSAGIEQGFKLLSRLLNRGHQRDRRSLSGLQNLFQYGQLIGANLQEKDGDLQRGRTFRLSFR